MSAHFRQGADMLPEAIGLLVVEYWMSPSKAHNAGVHFDNGYASEALAYILHSVMQKQTEFSLPVDFGRQGLQQIATPIQHESIVASAQGNETLHHLCNR